MSTIYKGIEISGKMLERGGYDKNGEFVPLVPDDIRKITDAITKSNTHIRKALLLPFGEIKPPKLDSNKKDVIDVSALYGNKALEQPIKILDED